MRAIFLCISILLSSTLLASQPQQLIQKSQLLTQALRQQASRMSDFERAKTNRLLDNLLETVGADVIGPILPGHPGVPGQRLNAVEILLAMNIQGSFASTVSNAIKKGITLIGDHELNRISFICDAYSSSTDRRSCLIQGLKHTPFPVALNPRQGAQVIVASCQTMSSSTDRLNCLTNTIRAANTFRGQQTLAICTQNSGFASTKVDCIVRALDSL